MLTFQQTLNQLLADYRSSLSIINHGVPNDGFTEAHIYSSKFNIMSIAAPSKQQELVTTDELLFGIELEFLSTNHTLAELSPLLTMGLFKEECTADGEYVSFPYTYEQMVERITKLSIVFDKLLSGNKTLNAYSTIGMHIHLSRKNLTDTQYYVLRQMFCADDDDLYHMETLCGRYGNEYCSYVDSPSRYVAFNITNKDTVEIRAFLSPSSAKGILYNLALVKAWLSLENPIYGKDWDTMFPEFAVNGKTLTQSGYQYYSCTGMTAEEYLQTQTSKSCPPSPCYGDMDGDDVPF